jgi:hypothetical protein
MDGAQGKTLAHRVEESVEESVEEEDSFCAAASPRYQQVRADCLLLKDQMRRQEQIETARRLVLDAIALYEAVLHTPTTRRVLPPRPPRVRLRALP